MATTNAAYDLTRFEARTAAQREAEQRPQIQKVKKTSAASRVSPVKAIACMLLVIAVTSALLYTRVQLTECTQKVESANETYTSLEAEGTRMSLELEGKVSLKNAEDYASSELGMTKMDNKSVEYLRLTQENKIKVPNEPQKGLWESIQEFFVNLLS